MVAFGEVGLTGEIRNVNFIEKRISEAAKLGFKKCIVPDCKNSGIIKVDGMEIISSEVEENKEISQILDKEVGRFKNVDNI